MQNGDIAFENGDLHLIDGVEELQQSMKICTSTNRGEWFLDPEFGFDFFVVLGQNVTDGQIRSEVLQALANEPRIDTIEDLEIDRSGRYMKAYYKAILVDGTSIESEVTPGA